MIWVRRGLAVVALGVVLYLFWPLWSDLRDAADLLRHAGWPWLAGALAIQIASYMSLTGLNYLLLRPFEGRVGFGRLAAILTAMAFIEVGLPSAGASGVVLRARLLGKGGYSAEAATVTLILENLYLGVIMACASLGGLWRLVQDGQIGPAQGALLAAGAGSLLALLALVYRLDRGQAQAERMVGWLARRWNRLALRLRRQPYPPEMATARLAQFYEGLARLRRAPRWALLLAAAGRVSLDVASLAACFAAFRYAISPGALLTGYGLTLLLSGLAALPGGLGLSDASLAVVFSRLGAPGAVALAAALVYRLIAFWLLRFVGFVSWQRLEAQA